FAPTGAIGRRADAVEPVVPADEVAAGPPEHRHAKGAHRLQDVLAEAARVAERRALLEDPAVDAAAEMLDEVAVDPPVHGADPPREVDADSSHAPESRGRARGLSTRLRRATAECGECLTPPPGGG